MLMENRCIQFIIQKSFALTFHSYANILFSLASTPIHKQESNAGCEFVTVFHISYTLFKILLHLDIL